MSVILRGLWHVFRTRHSVWREIYSSDRVDFGCNDCGWSGGVS